MAGILRGTRLRVCVTAGAISSALFVPTASKLAASPPMAGQRLWSIEFASALNSVPSGSCFTRGCTNRCNDSFARVNAT